MQPKKFGVIGHPIGHSLSKVMHTRVFKEMNLPHTYEAFDVAPENLEQFIKQTDLAGINVTIPHKVEVMKLMDALDQSAKDIQAVNTVKFDETKTGYNTDGIGFLESLKEEGISLANKNILVIGAGGASRAILTSLKNSEARIFLANRTRQKALDLNEQLNLNATVISFDQSTFEKYLPTISIIVNTTSLGMHPHEDASPIPKESLKPNHIIFDVIYNPLKTKLIKDAESIGCKTISGVNMLVHQGAQSLRIWLGIEPPIQAMKEEVLKNLSN
ncbi:shikimate dehydrogenase [archaeon]|jgi:shikimate dehydrogenase|nr:shikimate dehydrogenase [archaeon]